MKIYNQKTKTAKSWAINLRRSANGESVYLAAVDSKTGELIADLILFDSAGAIFNQMRVEECLLDKGYDPHEHGNEFDQFGSIVIE